jgi:organic radical activating enzyme
MKTLCVLPWTHLATHPNGLVSPCCVANYENGVCFSRTNNDVLNLGHNTIDEIMNSDSFTEIRRKMKNGEKPIECMGCYRDEENGIESKRMQENKNFTVNNLFLKQEKFPLRFVELRLGNVCNIKCLTCNPMSSSKWIEDVKKLPELQDNDHYNYSEFTSKWYRNKDWYDQLLEHSEQLELIYINGGEPTLIKEHFYFLEKLIENDRAKNIQLLYNINLTLMPEKFIEMLKEFKHVKMQLSIDDLEQRNYYIRYPSQWDVIMKNMETIKNEKFQTSITQTVSVYNICNVSNFYKFFNDIKIESNIVHSPNFLHVSNLPKELKVLAEHQINEIPDTAINYKTNNPFSNKSNKIKLLHELNRAPTASNEKQTLDFIRMMDKVRNHNIVDFLPEFGGIV